MLSTRGLVRPVAAVVLVAFVGVMAPIPAAADDDADALELKRGFLKPLRFSYANREPGKVYGFSGLSFTSDFKDVMGQYPPALRQAKHALPYNGIALAGQLTVTALSLKLLIDTIGEAKDVSEGKLVDDSFQTGIIIPMIVAAGVTIVGMLAGSSHLKKGVKMFNNHHRSNGYPR